MTQRFDAELPHPPPRRSGLRPPHGGAPRLRAVPVRRRSGEPDGRAGHLARGPPEASRAARPQRCGAGAVRPLRVEGGPVRFRAVLPAEAAGARDDRRAAAGDARARARGGGVRHRRRHSDGRLHRHHRNSWLSRLFLTISLVGISLPTFLIGILLIYIFAVTLGVLPSFGRGEVVKIGWWSTGLLTVSGLKALVLPAITLGLFQMTLVTRLVRSEMLEVLRTDYIRFARARGLPNRAIHFRHALRNTLVPVITIIGLQVGALIAFAIITETVFQWPGMGLLFIQSVQQADIPVMSAYLMLVAVLFVAINVAVDMLYAAVDPRIRVVAGSA